MSLFDRLKKKNEEKADKPRLHIVITDNETGNVLLEKDAMCIVGAIGEDKKNVNAVSISHAPILVVAGTLLGAQQVIDRTLEKDPMLKLAVATITSEVTGNMEGKL